MASYRLSVVSLNQNPWKRNGFPGSTMIHSTTCALPGGQKPSSSQHEIQGHELIYMAALSHSFLMGSSHIPQGSRKPAQNFYITSCLTDLCMPCRPQHSLDAGTFFDEYSDDADDVACMYKPAYREPDMECSVLYASHSFHVLLMKHTRLQLLQALATF